MERIKTENDDVIAFEVVDSLTQEDYFSIIEPALDQADRNKTKIRFLIYFGPRFKSFTAGAAWEDFKVGIKYTHLFEKCAIVSDLGWLRGVGHIVGSLMPCSFQTFKNTELSSAMSWLNSGVIGLNYELNKEKGILVLKIDSSLTSSTFEKLSLVVDSYIEEQGNLNGLIIHFRDFPGWEDFGSLVRHIKFVQDHHTKINKVAFVGNSSFVKILPMLSSHFVKAVIKQFGFDELENAKDWASQK